MPILINESGAKTPVYTNFPRHTLALGVGLAASFIACTSWAQSNPHSEHRHLNTMVVTAVPLSSPITVETDPRLPRQPMPASDGADYLQTIPGFSAIRNGGTNGDPVFRGMFGSRLRVLTNGSQMLGACPARMDAPSSYISPENYDSLTVTKGPQSVIWGPGASAATVRFDRGPEVFEEAGTRIDASVMTGTYGRFYRRIDAALGNQDGYLRITGNQSEANDYKDGDGNLVPSQWDKWNGDVAIGWTPDEDTWFEVTAGRGDGEARYAGRSMDGSKFLRETVGLRFRHENLGEHWKRLEMQANYAYADHIMDDFTLREPGHMDMSEGMAMRVDRRTRSARIASTWEWENTTWIAGVDAEHQVHRNEEGSQWQPDYEQTQFGAFSEVTRFIGERDRLIGGTRLDRYRASDESLNTPTAGQTRRDTLPSAFVRYEQDLANTSATWYAGVGYVERFPDYWELSVYHPGPEGSLNAFDGVKPEKTTQIDAGAQYEIDRLSAWVSGYAGVVNDFILFDYAASMGNSQIGNVDAQIAGAEVGAQYQFNDNWIGNASLAYGWGRNRDDHEALPQIPPLEANVGLTYEQDAYAIGGIWRGVAAQNRIARDKGNVVGQDLETTSGFGVFSLNGSYRASNHLTLSIGVDNVFDTTYTEHLNLAGNSAFGYPADLETGINEPGRMVWARADLNF